MQNLNLFTDRLLLNLEIAVHQMAVSLLSLCPPAHLDMPLLTVTPCNRNLCVHLQPPREDLREIYETFSYKLRIKCNNADNIEQVLYRDIVSS